MSIRDWWKTKIRVITERDHAWHELDKLRHILETEEDIEVIRQAVLWSRDADPPRVMPGSDIGEGKLIIQHWAVAVLARSFVELLNEVPGAVNYLIMPFADKEGREVEITIQRKGMMSPHQKMEDMKRQLEELKESSAL